MAPSNSPSPPTAAPLQPGDLLTAREAAAILGTTERTLANWRWRGCGPCVTHVGLRMVRYRRRDLEEFLRPAVA